MSKWVMRILLVVILIGAGVYYFLIVYPDKIAYKEYNLGIHFRESGDLESSIAHLHKAIMKKSDFSQAYNELAVSYNLKNNYDEAINTAKKAIALDPQNATALYNLGTYYENKNMNKEAAETYRKFLTLKPDDPEAEELKSRLPALESNETIPH